MSADNKIHIPHINDIIKSWPHQALRDGVGAGNCPPKLLKTKKGNVQDERDVRLVMMSAAPTALTAL